MKRIFLTLLAAIVCGLSAMAGINTIVVAYDGELINIALEEKPVVTVTEEALILTTDSGLTLSFPTDNVVNFTSINSLPTDISDLLAADSATPTFYMEGNVMKVYNLEPNSAVGLYGLDGTVYLQGRADAEGNLEIDLGRYVAGNGVAILKTSNKSIKISKK